MRSATNQPAATSSASQRDRPRGATLPGWLGLPALLSVLALALAGPAAAATHSGGPSPDPSPTAAGTGGPSPDPVPQATGAGGVTSQPSVGTPSSGTPSSSTTIPVPYTVPAAPEVSHPATSTGSNHTSSGPATNQADSATRGTTAAANRAGHTRKPHHHAVAHPTAAQREAALAYQQLRHQLALESRTAGPISAAAATITSSPAHTSGTVLLIGAAVLFLLAVAGGTLLRRLWRLHGQWYRGKPA